MLNLEYSNHVTRTGSELRSVRSMIAGERRPHKTILPCRRNTTRTLLGSRDVSGGLRVSLRNLYVLPMPKQVLFAWFCSSEMFAVANFVAYRAATSSLKLPSTESISASRLGLQFSASVDCQSLSETRPLSEL